MKVFIDNTVLRSNMNKPKGGLVIRTEHFKEIEYQGTQFRVGEFGTIYRNGSPAHVIISPDGYHKVSTKNRNIGVHRLVAMCWVENDDPATKTEVNHKDFCRTNNRADNLEWMSHADNVRYSSHRKNIRGERNPNYGNRKLSNFYSANPSIAKEKQGRPGIRNGRCRPISVYKDGVLIKRFEYVVLCAEYIKETYGLDVSIDGIRSQIDKSIRNNSKYKGLTFVKE